MSLKFGDAVLFAEGNELAGAVGKVLSVHPNEGDHRALVKLPDGRQVNAPVYDLQLVDQEQFIYSGSGKRSATPEEVQRVRETECERHGHSFDAVTTYGSLDPQRFLCSNCGKSWRVSPDPMQAEKLAWVKGHLEGYVDALSVTGAKADIEGLITSLREDAEQLEQLGEAKT